MDVILQKSSVQGVPAVQISGSKSETNRLLLLQALYPEIRLGNLSDSDDAAAMKLALASHSEVIDIGHAGTAMRFLTAYFAIRPYKTVTLTGSARMQQRPIGILVEALRQLGAKIEYLGNEGFPPLKITGQKITKSEVAMRADVSSQFITALMLIAPKLENGLNITLDGEITSRPYIEMTLSLLNQIGIRGLFSANSIKILPVRSVGAKSIQIESDWSSASYFYSVVALSGIGTQITLSTFKTDSFQGDRALVDLYKNFGVEAELANNSIIVCKTAEPKPDLRLNLKNNPDLAQTIAVTAFGLGMSCHLSGLHTLKIKETDRLLALKTELEKLGATISITDEAIDIQPSAIKPDVKIDTYGDHRMAMAFAPLAIKVPIAIADAEVVSKSYPDFWKDMERIGIVLNRVR